MGWLHREITIHNQHDHLIGSVVRVWQPLHRRCLPLSTFVRAAGPKRARRVTFRVIHVSSCAAVDQSTDASLSCSYDLYIVRDEDIGSEDPVLTQFGRVSEPFWSALFTWRYPVRAPDDSQISLIERMFGAGMQVSSPAPRSFALRANMACRSAVPIT